MTEDDVKDEVRGAEAGLGAEGAMNGARTAEPARPQVDPETMAKLAQVRTRIQASVGQIVLAMMNLPRYRHQALADISRLVLEPLMRDRIAIASARGEAQDEALAGIAIWATVSDEVDAAITEQIRAGVFPIRLGQDDWTSGETLWLLDVIAPNRKLATAVLANFRQIAKDRNVKVHPLVGRAVDPEILEKMKVKPEETAQDQPAAG